MYLRVAAFGERKKVCQVQIQVHDRIEPCMLFLKWNHPVPSAGSDFLEAPCRKVKQRYGLEWDYAKGEDREDGTERERAREEM